MVDLYEKRVDPRKEDLSAGRSINLALSHRGIKALKSACVFDQVEPQLIPMKGRMIHSEDGALDFQPYSINPKEYINSVSRGELNKILMTAAENTGNVNIHFDHSLIDVTIDELKFSSGKTIPKKGIIFGADGAGSVVRKYIDSMTDSPSIYEPLGHAYKELNIAASDDGEFQMDANSLHIWPRGEFMLIALPNTDKSFTCTLFMPNKGDVSFASLMNADQVVGFFTEYFADALPLLEDFPQTYFNNPTGKLTTIHAEQWYYKNFCLIGDAAHAVVPFFGQGMNASFEDCEVLMDYIDKCHGNWQAIFTTFNEKRKPDTDAIAKMAIENYIEMRDMVAQPEYIVRKKLANDLHREFPNQFIPRYNMVSFSSIPYAEVYRRGMVQKEIISNLKNENLDMLLAEALINEQLEPVN
jgi:kynurenine 3-monooxygenase